MKFYILFTIIFIASKALGLTLPFGQQINITRNMCFQTVGVSAENRQRIENYDYPNTQETYRYMRCIFENLELWSEANGIQDQRINEILEGQRDRSNILDVVKGCNEESRTEDPDVWFYNTVDCIASNGNVGEVLENVFTAN
ncbi:uncharacterized protein LOC129916736 [Episyrphus balteatus]|uniref:uncharacterized protein LOC129916736 n=1 Tax=Episyrphus balteatus TaxID=286459 RepID=UPI0024857E33|nr:uncharacterized protein LOC129916736 [Episyrphus balteatus]